ncbi:hypothetical protein ACS0TY_005514 [Phlomoides rotata]
MPLGKYHCDYCDKQFQDTPSSRRRHIQGVAHQRAKAQWYDAIRSSSSSQLGRDQVQDFRSTGKGVCNRFLRTGSCQFGDLCKYYHPNMNTHGMEGMSSANNVPSRSIPALFFGNQMGASLENLPPSLWPPPEGGYPPLPLIDWG